MEFERFLAVLRALERERVEYALVGATALGLHGIIRATEDMDLFVRSTADNVERLRRALRSVWDDPDIDQITLADLAGEFPTIRYGPPGPAWARRSGSTTSRPRSSRWRESRCRSRHRRRCTG
jgi:hypothetical protein